MKSSTPNFRENHGSSPKTDHAMNPNLIGSWKAEVISSPDDNRLVGLVAKASASRVEDPGFESRLGRDFSGSSHTSDLKY